MNESNYLLLMPFLLSILLKRPLKLFYYAVLPEQIQDNPFKLIGKDWALVTSGTKDSFNTMTVSWGGVGVMWGKPVAFTFIRPQRHTFGFIENNNYFTMSFFDEEYRDALNFCGTKSGRDDDKPKETGLTPAFTEDGIPYFEQAMSSETIKTLKPITR